MNSMVSGFVRNGVIVPNALLPEGAPVEIRILNTPPEVPEELRVELAAWQLAGAEALEMVERLAQESKPNETR